MKLTPLTERGRKIGANKVVGIVVADEGEPYALGEWGRTAVADAPSNAILYAHRKTPTYRLVRSGRGRLRRWKHSIVGYEIDGKRIRGTRGIFERKGADDALYDLVQWADWVRSFDARPGTFVGTGGSLLRATLERPAFWREPQFDGGAIALGARVERSVDRGRYAFVSRWDIHAAYPDSMGKTRFPRRYVEVANANVNDDGYALADVRIPEMLWAPLPVKRGASLTFPYGELTGIWNLRELRMADQAGCEVNIRRAWIARGRLDLFGERWQEAVRTGRALEGVAGNMAKMTLSATWGMFAMSGQGEWWSFPNGTGFERELDPTTLTPRSPAVAGNIVSRVRERLFREALSQDFFILGCHTDGVIAEEGASFSPNGGGIGGWRHKDDAVIIDYLSPQVYRTFDVMGDIHYVVSGAENAEASRVFQSFSRDIRYADERRRHIRAQIARKVQARLEALGPWPVVS